MFTLMKMDANANSNTILNKDFLKQSGDWLSFTDANQFESVVSTLDRNVPARNKGRKSYHRERYCLIEYLIKAVRLSKISFPFSVRKSEGPDFIIQLNCGKTIGIEHREITTEKYQQYLTDSSKYISSKPIWLSQFSHGNQPADSMNSGWVGEEVEREWVALALRAISDKFDKLNKSHIQKLDSYELLLYSNTHLPDISIKEVVPLLTSRLNEMFQNSNFIRSFKFISIIYGNEVHFRALSNQE
jgi:hypothetical protein